MSFCGGPSSPLMKCITPNGPGNTSPVRTDVRSKYSSYLKYYTSACELDPDVKDFDSLLYAGIASVIKSLADQTKSKPTSQVSLMDVYEFLLDLNRDAVRKIIDSKADVRKSKDLTSLVHLYFENSSKTLDFCNTVQNCVKRAEISQRIIRQAVKQFDAESVDAEKTKNKYAKTLEELNKFKANGDPFDGDFLTQYESLYEEQALLLEKVAKLKAKLDKKQRDAKTWRRLSNIIFITAFVSVLLLSVAAVAVTAPPVLAVLAAGLTAPIEVGGKWCNDTWKKYEKAVKRQRGLVSTVKTVARVDKIATDNIRDEVEKLRNNISSMLESVEIAVEREEDESETRRAMQEIKKKVDGLTDKIKEVGQHAAMFSGVIVSGRLVVLGHIDSLPSKNGYFYKIFNGISNLLSRLFT